MTPEPDDATVHRLTRKLRVRAEAIVGLFFQTPESRTGGLGLTSIEWYMAGRAAALGAVRPSVAAALFAPLSAAFVERGLATAWGRVSPEQIIEARTASASKLLAPIVEASGSPMSRINELLRPIATASPVAGAPLYAGLRSLPWPKSSVAKLLRNCELIREHRGDMHNIAWLAAGLDAAEINVLSEMWRGVPVGSVATNQMKFTAAETEQALERLRDAGLAVGAEITEGGMRLREEIELQTSLLQVTLAEALQPHADEVFELLTPVSQGCHDVTVAYWDEPRDFM